MDSPRPPPHKHPNPIIKPSPKNLGPKLLIEFSGHPAVYFSSKTMKACFSSETHTRTHRGFWREPSLSLSQSIFNPPCKGAAGRSFCKLTSQSSGALACVIPAPDYVNLAISMQSLREFHLQVLSLLFQILPLDAYFGSSKLLVH